MRYPVGTRSAATLLLGALAAAFILNGNKAEAVLQCTFGSLLSCTGNVQNLNFSNFSFSNGGGGNIDPEDEISIDFISATEYTIDAFFDKGANAQLSGTGNFSFTVTASPGYYLGSALTNLSETTASQFSTSLTGFSGGPLVNQSVVFQNFNQNVSTTNAVVTWNATTPSLKQYELTLTTQVPAPFPVLGAAAAFRFSRKLRKRVQARA